MDGANKSKRIYPGHTTAELYAAAKDPHISEALRDRLQLAIRQRDPLSHDFQPILIVPQI